MCSNSTSYKIIFYIIIFFGGGWVSVQILFANKVTSNELVSIIAYRYEPDMWDICLMIFLESFWSGQKLFSTFLWFEFKQSMTVATRWNIPLIKWWSIWLESSVVMDKQHQLKSLSMLEAPEAYLANQCSLTSRDMRAENPPKCPCYTRWCLTWVNDVTNWTQEDWQYGFSLIVEFRCGTNPMRPWGSVVKTVSCSLVLIVSGVFTWYGLDILCHLNMSLKRMTTMLTSFVTICT